MTRNFKYVNLNGKKRVVFNLKVSPYKANFRYPPEHPSVLRGWRDRINRLCSLLRQGAGGDWYRWKAETNAHSTLYDNFA